MGKKSFALGVLTALAAAAATEDSHTRPTYERVTYTPVTYTPVTYTPVTYTPERARIPFEKMVRINRAFTISNADALYEVGKELRRVYLEDETSRTSLSFDERKVLRKVIDMYHLPIGDAKMLAYRVGRLVKSTMV